MKIGVICSSGGSAFISAVKILFSHDLINKNNVFVITDRICGIEKKCEKEGINYLRLEKNDNKDFSTEAKNILNDFGCNIVFLFFLRLVTEDIYNNYITLNIHPSLLPSFKGFEAIKKSIDYGSRFIGSTLHLADSDPDSGKIVAQTVTPVLPPISFEQINKISYIQKTYLTMTVIELLSEENLIVKNPNTVILKNGLRSTCSSSPALNSDKLIKEFNKFQKSEGINVLIP